MSLDFVRQTFFSAVREAVASDQPPRKRLEELFTASVDKIRSNEHLPEHLIDRISHLRESRGKVSQLSEREVKDLLREIVSVYDAIAAHLYGSGTMKHAGI